VATFKQLVAGFLHEVEALALSADVLEGRFHAWRGLCHLFSAVSARGGHVLIACLSDMVGLRVALDTEILLALITSQPIVRHMSRCLMCKRLTLIILEPLLYISRQHFHDVSALARHESIVHLNHLLNLVFFNFLYFFGSQILFGLICLQWLHTLRAFDCLTFGLFLDNIFLKTIDMDLMPAF